MFATPDGGSHYEACKRPTRLGRYCTFVLFQRNLSSCLVFYCFRLYVRLCSRASTCPNHLIVLYLIALMLLDEDYKS